MLKWLNLSLNPLVKLILRSPLAFVLSGSVLLLTFIGRRSGRSFTTPVAYVRRGNRILVGVAAPETKKWWRNYKEPGEVMLRIGKRDLTGRAEAITDSDLPRLISLLEIIAARFGKLAGSLGYREPVVSGSLAGCVVVEITLD